MKKISITLSAIMLLATAVFIGCRKDASGLPQKNVENVNRQSTSRMNTGTPGELHNYILDEYHTQYGFTPSNLTIVQVRDVIKHCTEIAIAAEILDNTVNPDDYADAMVQEKVTLGMFNNNGTYKSISENLAIMETQIANVSIRAAIHNINNYNGNIPDFLAFAQTQITGLQNLSSNEQDMLIGYESVLSSSFAYWDNRYQGLPGRGSVNHANADAFAFMASYIDSEGGMGGVRTATRDAAAASASAFFQP